MDSISDRLQMHTSYVGGLQGPSGGCRSFARSGRRHHYHVFVRPFPFLLHAHSPVLSFSDDRALIVICPTPLFQLLYSKQQTAEQIAWDAGHNDIAHTLRRASAKANGAAAAKRVAKALASLRRSQATQMSSPVIPIALDAAACQAQVDELIALCEKESPLSSSDVAAIQQLLAAGVSVVNGTGKSK